MKWLLLLVITGALFFAGCKQPETLSLKDYHAVTDSGVQTGGVRMIPIETPVGKFKV
ncbi:MAG: hypothetical protein JO301_04370 [Chitinophagaceae bacterium]|nr:hypothetical protein [Chitinophagaceae bacterium]